MSIMCLCLSISYLMSRLPFVQLHDMIQPEKEGCFTLRDLKRARSLAGTLFNILFNLNKFIAFETRDPFVIRQARMHGRQAKISQPAVLRYRHRRHVASKRLCAVLTAHHCLGSHATAP